MAVPIAVAFLFSRSSSRVTQLLVLLLFIGLIVRALASLTRVGLSNDIHNRIALYLFTIAVSVVAWSASSSGLTYVGMCPKARRRGSMCLPSVAFAILLFVVTLPLSFLGLNALTEQKELRRASDSIDEADIMTGARIAARVYDVAKGKTPVVEGLEVVDTVRNTETDVYVAVAVSKATGDAYIVFSGSVSAENWKYNMNAESAPIRARPAIAGSRGHRGFIKAYESVSEIVETRVLRLPAVRAAPRIYIVGHSLGAALAQLCTVHVSQQLLAPAHAPALAPASKPLRTLLFASPSVGDSAFIRAFVAATRGEYVSFSTPFDVIPALANTNFANVGNQRIIVPTTASMFFRQTHSMSGTYLPTLESQRNADRRLTNILESVPFVVFLFMIVAMSARLLSLLKDTLIPHRTAKLRSAMLLKAITFALISSGGGMYAAAKLVSMASNLRWHVMLVITAVLMVAFVFLARSGQASAGASSPPRSRAETLWL